MRSRPWSQLSKFQKVMVTLLTPVQVSLAAAAWADLARRPPEKVNGSKRTWAAVIGINFVGPLAYFRFGRRK